jgi:PAS domain S-box-containing protein
MKPDAENEPDLRTENRRLKKMLAELQTQLVRKIHDENLLKDTLQELHIHQEELRTQNEDLIRAQEEIETTNRKYQDLYNFAPVGFFNFDLHGKILEVNLTGAELLGRYRSDLIGKPFSFFLDKKSKHEFFKHIRKVLNGNPAGNTIWLTVNNRTAFPAEIVSTPFDADAREAIYCRSAIKDISKRHEAEKILKHAHQKLEQANQELKKEIRERQKADGALRQSEKQFKDMADLLPSVICETDTTQRITFINKAGLELFKLTKNETDQGVYITDFLPGKAKTMARKRLTQVLNGEILGSAEFQMIDKKGAELSLILNSAPIREGDTITSVRISIVDVTELKKLQLRLRQAWKMEAITTLAGGIAHEFNNALSVIVANIDLLRSEQPDNIHIQKHADDITTSTARMADLTKQMLAYARGGKYWLQSVSLNDIVQNALSLIRHSLNPAIEVITELQNDVASVEIDVSQFQLVLTALVTNACEAMQNSGRICIRTQNTVVDEKLAGQNAGLKPGVYVCLQIEDNGPGMDENTRQRIFEPFFSTKFPGRGMGMAAVYGIVKNHDGWIGVDSRLDIGTVVSIFLPKKNSH